MAKYVDKGRFKYFPVIQDSSKPPHKETVVYINRSGRTDPQTGFIEPPVCKGMEPDGAGMYVIDMNGEFAELQLAAMNRIVAKKIAPVIGPFDTREDAIIAERKVRPLTVEEELAILRREKAEREAKEMNKSEPSRKPDGGN